MAQMLQQEPEERLACRANLLECVKHQSSEDSVAHRSICCQSIQKLLAQDVRDQRLKSVAQNLLDHCRDGIRTEQREIWEIVLQRTLQQLLCLGHRAVTTIQALCSAMVRLQERDQLGKRGQHLKRQGGSFSRGFSCMRGSTRQWRLELGERAQARRRERRHSQRLDPADLDRWSRRRLHYSNGRCVSLSTDWRLFTLENEPNASTTARFVTESLSSVLVESTRLQLCRHTEESSLTSVTQHFGNEQLALGSR